MTDFTYTTGKNIGSINKSKLGEFFGLSHSAINNTETKHPLRFECLYFGAFCKANNIKKEDLMELLKIKLEKQGILYCPKCFEQKPKVIKTVHEDDKYIKIRLCEKCGYKFETQTVKMGETLDKLLEG